MSKTITADDPSAYVSDVYLDPNGRKVFVAQGLDDSWGAFRRKPSGALQRLKSPALPMVRNMLTAIEDLDRFAERLSWPLAFNTSELEPPITPIGTIGHPQSLPLLPTEQAVINRAEARKARSKGGRRKGEGGENNTPDAPRPTLQGGVPREFSQHVAVGLIDPSPYQVRRDFPDEEIRDLADSMAAHGLVQPICVRPIVGGHYELMEGERRLRAAKLLGWEVMLAVVREATDAQAREIVLLAQIQRKDFNPIEKARAYRQILDAEGGPTQTDLAKRLGVTQGQVSNTLRLLKLPKRIQDLVISGEITGSQARSLVPLAGAGKALDGVVELIDQIKKGKHWGFKNAADMFAEGDLNELRNAVDKNVRTIRTAKEKIWMPDIGAQVSVFVPDAQQREKLGIVEIDLGGEDREVATDPEMYDAMAKEYYDRLIAKKEKKASKDTAEARKGAEKADPEAERIRRLRFNAQKARRIEDLAVNWLRWLVAKRIQDQTQTTQEELLGLLIEAAADWHIQGYVGGRNGPRPPAKGHVADRACQFLAKCFWDADEPMVNVPDPKVRRWAAELRIDLDAAWKDAQLGPLSEALWRALGKERCIQVLAGVRDQKLDHPEPEKASASALIGELTADWNRGQVPMPAELEKALGLGKKGRKAKN